MVHGKVGGLKNGELMMLVYLEEIVDVRWLTSCYGPIGKCSDFELYSVMYRKPAEVTKLITC